MWHVHVACHLNYVRKNSRSIVHNMDLSENGVLHSIHDFITFPVSVYDHHWNSPMFKHIQISQVDPLKCICIVFYGYYMVIICYYNYTVISLSHRIVGFPH